MSDLLSKIIGFQEGDLVELLPIIHEGCMKLGKAKETTQKRVSRAPHTQFWCFNCLPDEVLRVAR